MYIFHHQYRSLDPRYNNFFFLFYDQKISLGEIKKQKLQKKLVRSEVHGGKQVTKKLIHLNYQIWTKKF